MSAMGWLCGPFFTFPRSSESCVQLHIPIYFPLPQKASPLHPPCPPPAPPKASAEAAGETKAEASPSPQARREADGHTKPLASSMGHHQRKARPWPLRSHGLLAAKTAFQGKEGTEKSPGSL